jgi:hypothetical protein
MRTSAHRSSAATHEPSSRASTTSHSRPRSNEAATARPPSYGIAFADRTASRISDPDETHERSADRLAHSFLASNSSVSASDTLAAFGRFTGHDLSRIRIHHDDLADAQARALGTGAFTLGDDIGIARGRSSAAVLAHELAHVVAQRSRPELAHTLWREPPKDEEEKAKQKQTAGKPKKLDPPAKKLEAAAKPGASKPASGKPGDPVPFVHPFILAGLPGDLLNRSLTDRHKELRLNGTEWYGAWTLGWSLINPLLQPPVVQGGTATPGKWDQDYGRFSKYVSALQRLTPGSGDPYLDVASLATGTRVEDWISHERFLKEALPKYWWQALIGLALAQGAFSGYSEHENANPGAPGSLATHPVYRHFGLLTGLAGLATKSKFLTLGNTPLSFGMPIGNEAGLPSTGPLSAGIPGAGLTLDFQKGVGQDGARYTFGMPFNLGRQIRPDEAGKPKSPLELGLWGSYDHLVPTPTMLAAGGEPGKTWSVGALGGYNWLGALDYRFRQSGGMQMHQGNAGLGYLPRTPGDALKAGPISFPRFGVAATYANWAGADASTFGPRLGSDKGDAWRVSPYLDLGIDLGRGYQLSLGGQASATFRGGTDMQKYMDGLRVMIALQHQAKGTPDADKKRIEASYSQNHYEWLDPNSPLMHAIQVKGQWGPWFGGTQVNWMQGGLEALKNTPYAKDFANSADPLRDLSLLFMLGYRFGKPNYPWGFRP